MCPVSCVLFPVLLFLTQPHLTSLVRQPDIDRTQSAIMLLLLLLLCSQGTPTQSISSVMRLGDYYYYDVSTFLFERKLQVESEISEIILRAQSDLWSRWSL